LALALITEQLAQAEQEALSALDKAETSAALEEIRLNYLGGKGVLTSILRGLGELSKEERPKVGALANSVKEKIQVRLDERKAAILNLEISARLSQEKIDVTLPGFGRKLGNLHPMTKLTEELTQIFYGMGFSVEDGPEIETEYYNFDALNTPSDHPARDEQDTFYTNMGDHVILRSQTSPMQIRAMEKGKPPFRFVVSGRVYRNEEINARKFPIFHQMEGLLIDRDVTFGQLKGTLNEFIRLLFGKQLKTRFRPDFFPFTEPSAELDCECPFCTGSGCRTCGHRGWIELLGCGMVDPAVLEGAGIDPMEWSGFAFGVGLERLAMLKYGINDIRHFYTSDLRFLKQF
jgi:phenylalanyl-tRNA synthetase alpha chain